LYGLGADELGLEGRLAVFEEHGDDLGGVVDCMPTSRGKRQEARRDPAPL
jgi:hypothetical protein